MFEKNATFENGDNLKEGSKSQSVRTIKELSIIVYLSNSQCYTPHENGLRVSSTDNQLVS